MWLDAVINCFGVLRDQLTLDLAPVELKMGAPRSVQLPPRRGPESATVREQLERMLADPLFRHSRRYPTLLRYVVERTLEGAAVDLKERTLGVAVFGRDPAYDTTTDPIVRATASEIRRRIAQYYQVPGREHEVRIDLSPGSYVPEFRMPRTASPVPEVLPDVRPRRSRLRYWPFVAAVLVALAGLAVILWIKPWFPRNALADFWRPVLDSSKTVLICIGQRRYVGAAPESLNDASPDLARVRREMEDPTAPISLFRLYYMGSQNVALPDVVMFGHIAGLLLSNGKTYHVRGESSTTFPDLRDGPVILIGAFNNDWTMHLMGALRFDFERDGDTFWIQDRQNPARKNWAVDYSAPYLKLTEDYALITRALEPTTGRMVVVVGGLTGYGTLAAAEFLSNPSYMEAAIQKAPTDWRRKNVEFVIATKVVNGGSGPPRVAEQYFW
jgi:hypothetical protein